MQFNFDNRFVRQLPGDPEKDNYRRQVRDALWSAVAPTAVANPQLICHSPDMAARLGLSETDIHSRKFAEVFGGNTLLPGMVPVATRYGGHQFGNWAGQLGDGRAISLGEVVTAAEQRWELQLKGAGETPYSRSADGRAVLRSSVREFLCSEAMYFLGVPTTRALSLVATGDDVVRDMFYDGRAKAEPGAVVCRAAPSFTRFGHFEILAAHRESELLEELIDFTIERDFSHLTGDNLRARWFGEVVTRTAELMAHWMAVGFVHGVMNTDNMSILGLTIDYGPYGWTDNFDLDWTPNTTDAGQRRYRFGNQPAIGEWNLQRLAMALSLVIDQQPLIEALQQYPIAYHRALDRHYAAKLGILDWQPEDKTLVTDLWQLMGDSQIDMTLFFRRLIEAGSGSPDTNFIAECSYLPSINSEKWQPWLERYIDRTKTQNSGQRAGLMSAANPVYVLRNYMAQEAIDLAEKGDYSRIETLLELLSNPYQVQTGMEQFTEKRPDWALNKAGCSQLSCSS